MRSARFGLLGLVVFVVPAWSQQTQPATPPAVQQAGSGAPFLKQALTAQTGGAPIADVTLSGTITVEITPTLVPETGTVSLAATSGGHSKTIITVPSGKYTDIRDYSGTTHTATLITPDGTQTLSPDSLMSPDPAWFFSAFLMSSTLASSDYVCADAGPETRAGRPVEHLAIWNYPAGMSGPVAMAIQNDTQQDLYLDSSTFLPVSLLLKLRGNYADTSLQHWGKSVLVPEEVRFSDYRQVQGRPVAFHIQLYIQGALFFDIQLSSATYNSGVVIAAS
jgi:hypothetical protein